MTDSLNVSQTDFAGIKSALKVFMSAQPEFTDYNFEGSAINVVLDALAYVTHYNAIYVNGLYADSFLDSAFKRSAVTSRAKELGYVPRSASCAKTNVRIAFTPGDSPVSITIPARTQFSANYDGNLFLFINPDAVVITPNLGLYTTDTQLIQGVFVKFRYTVDTANESQRFTINDENADLSYLTVKVYANDVDVVGETWASANTSGFSEITGTTKCYFLQEDYDGRYAVKFGDNTYGKSVVDGNIVEVEYLVTRGAAANNINAISATGNIAGYPPTVTVLDQASGGTPRETIEEIKLRAPGVFQAQNRAVTKNDYYAILYKVYSNIDDLVVWGGEENDPPAFGKVFICIKPQVGEYLSQAEKLRVVNEVLEPYRMISVIPEVVDPEYVKIGLKGTIQYFKNRTNKLAGVVATDAITGLTALFAGLNSQFNKGISYATLIDTVRGTNPAITSVSLTIEATKSIVPVLNVEQNYKLRYNTPLAHKTLRSTGFTLNGETHYLDDAPDFVNPNVGSVNAYRLSGNTRVYLPTAVGVINYKSGDVDLNDFAPSDVPVDSNLRKTLSITVSQGQSQATSGSVTTDLDVKTNGRNQIITFDAANTSITALAL